MTATLKVSLTESTKTLKDGKRATYYVLRWTDSAGKTREKSLGRTRSTGGDMTAREAKELRAEFERAMMTGDRPRDRLESFTLGTFIEWYDEQRKHSDTRLGFRKSFRALKKPTLAKHNMTLRYLREHFGEGQRLDSIDADAIERFLNALTAGELADARDGRQTFTLGIQTVLGHVRNAKAIWQWAKSKKVVHVNPWSDFDGAPLPSKPNYYVSLEDFETLLASSPSNGWRAFYALQRLAGLRRGEALSLVWTGTQTDTAGETHTIGVDLAARRIRLVGNSKTVTRYREVPICPRLAELLAARLDELDGEPAEGESVCGVSSHNLTRRAQAHIRAAGLTPWPKSFQALRSSAENDWKTAGIHEATYAAWAGHSATVSRKHYVSPMASEFDAVTRPETTLKLTG